MPPTAGAVPGLIHRLSALYKLQMEHRGTGRLAPARGEQPARASAMDRAQTDFTRVYDEHVSSVYAFLVIALRFGGDLNGPEIAELLGLSLANVQQILSRSLRRLRTLLSEPGAVLSE